MTEPNPEHKVLVKTSLEDLGAASFVIIIDHEVYEAHEIHEVHVVHKAAVESVTIHTYIWTSSPKIIKHCSISLPLTRSSSPAGDP